MKTKILLRSFTALVLMMLVLGLAPLAAQNPHPIPAKKL
jgi:hypothetical protein